MKLTHDQFTAVAFIFEKANGINNSNFEEDMIVKSGLADVQPVTLKNQIIDGLNNKFYANSKDRVSAYWALSKIHSTDLIPDFKRWLKSEIEIADPNAVFQLLIALGNLNEPVWNDDRDGSYAYDDIKLNMRDAKAYLKNSL